MKTLITLLIMMTSVFAAEDKTPFKKLFSMNDADQIVFVNELPTETDDFYYKPYGKPLKVDAKLLKILKSIEQTTVEEQFAPFIGILGKVAVLNKEGAPICILGVINWNSTFSVSDGKLADKKILSGAQGLYKQGKCEPFAKWMYAEIKKRSPEKIESYNKTYKQHGKTLEELLFGNKTKK